MKTAKITLFALSMTLTAGPAVSAAIYSLDDNWINWPSFSSTHGDENGTPNVRNMLVTVENNLLKQVDVVFSTNARQSYDSLFINTSYTVNSSGGNWDDWDYFIRDGFGSGHDGNTQGVDNEAGNGIYAVQAGYSYTMTADGGGWDVRENNPNGIDSLSLVSSNVGYSISGLSQGTDGLWHLTYSLSDGLALDGGFFVAYAPWCANDVIGGGDSVATNSAPVPEPATMLLFGAGLAGLAGFARQWRKE